MRFSKNSTLRLSYVGSQSNPPMGRYDKLPSDTNTSVNLYLRKVRINQSGYDSGKAYWGINNPVFCAYDIDYEIMIFVNAQDRSEACKKVREKLPNVQFYK